MDDLTPAMIVEALKTVDEFHIDLVDLCPKFVQKDGTLNETLMAMSRQEIDEAVDQAQAYIESVRKAVSRVIRFRGA